MPVTGLSCCAAAVVTRGRSSVPETIICFRAVATKGAWRSEGDWRETSEQAEADLPALMVEAAADWQRYERGGGEQFSFQTRVQGEIEKRWLMEGC